MIPVPTGVRVWLATGHTDMRKGFDGLALLVQETLRRDPHGGHLFVFRQGVFAKPWSSHMREPDERMPHPWPRQDERHEKNSADR